MIELKTKEDIMELFEAKNKLKEIVIDVAKELGFLNKSWRFKYYDVSGDSIKVIAYDYYFGTDKTKSIYFPIECLIDKEYFKTYKEEKERERQEKERERELRKQRLEEERERAEYERLKAKFEGVD